MTDPLSPAPGRAGRLLATDRLDFPCLRLVLSVLSSRRRSRWGPSGQAPGGRGARLLRSRRRQWGRAGCPPLSGATADGGRLTLGSPAPDPGFRRVLRAEGHGWACALRAWAPGAGGDGTAPSAPERPRRRVLGVSCPRLRGQPGAHVPLRASIRVARGFGPVPPTSHSAPRRTGRGVLSARGGFAGPPEAAAQFPPPSLPVTVRKGQREAPSAKGSCAPRLLCHVAPLTCTASGSRRGPLARQVSASNVGRRCSRRACRGRDRWIERPPHVVEKVKSDVTPAGA